MYRVDMNYPSQRQLKVWIPGRPHFYGKHVEYTSALFREKWRAGYFT
jgi:hypothetical protein